MLADHQEEVRGMIKKKGNKQWIEKQVNNMNQIIGSTTTRLDQIFTGLEMAIVKNTCTKVEMRDLEVFDKTKADNSNLKRLEDKFERMDKLVGDIQKFKEEYERERLEMEKNNSSSEGELEGLRDEDNLSHGQGSDPDVDPEELKDQIQDDMVRRSTGAIA